jgi:hypothetical protein
MIDGRSLEQLPEHIEWFFETQTDNMAENGLRDGVVFTDPLYGSRLQAGAWPPTLEHDSISRTGRQYLQSAQHPIDVIYAPHHSAANFDRIREACHDTLASAVVIGAEADWDPEALTLAEPEALVLPEGPRSEFLKALISWAQAEGKYVLPYDIDGPADFLRRSLQRIGGYGVEARKGSDIPALKTVSSEVYGAVQDELRIGFLQCMRQPMMWGQLGFGLQQLVTAERIAPTDAVAPIIGTAHYAGFTAMGKKIVRPEVASFTKVEYPLPPHALSFIKAFVNMTTKGGLTKEEMLSRAVELLREKVEH